MKSRELFLLAVKVIGFVVVLYGIQNVIDSLMISMGYANVNLSTPRYWAARGFIKIVAGVYLMVGSTPLVNQLYSQKPEAAEDCPQKPLQTQTTLSLPKGTKDLCNRKSYSL